MTLYTMLMKQTFCRVVAYISHDLKAKLDTVRSRRRPIPTESKLLVELIEKALKEEK